MDAFPELQLRLQALQRAGALCPQLGQRAGRAVAALAGARPTPPQPAGAAATVDELCAELRERHPGAWAQLAAPGGALAQPLLGRWLKARQLVDVLPFPPPGPAPALAHSLELAAQFLRGHPRRCYGLRVAPSRIPGAGLGLFAAAPLPQGSLLCVYRGTRRGLLEARELAEAGAADYLMGGFGLRDHVDAGPHPGRTTSPSSSSERSSQRCWSPPGT
eukprot:TRINITY_DN649_c0_g1_i4.p2 TRINITY_DN649_c0_g1~~TRINITY_DN649_c0_g1_i4.p2  ORF type:complete len:239 (+),score=45.92 TRINITY_DN649_c0_g1_i4:66-719(+)